MNEMPSKEVLKDMIKRLHDGEDFEDVKRQFGELVEKVTPEDIARAEQELVEEGMEIQEIQRLCEVHLALFKDTLDEHEVLAPEGHPVNTLMQEHNKLLLFADELKANASEIKSSEGFESIEDNLKHLDRIVEHLKDSQSHYLREENVLFPYLEKHGIVEPPKVMWMDHDQIRAIEKDIYALHDEKDNMDFHDFAKQLDEQSCALAEMLSNHFTKENNVLFPASMQVIEEGEWTEITKEFSEIGYCRFTPQPEVAEKAEEKVAEVTTGALIDFETGTLSMERLDAIFRTLPVDTTFVDNEDTVRFFSDGAGGIFMRTKASIGRKVQQCHPEKSVHKVNEILDDFRAGRRDVTEFWIDMKGRKIHIRYFAVRDRTGDYMGTLEVVQDITDLQKIEGEKRLL
ncbi:MAG: DUF438 domain-containing protein [Thermoplasmata archaeon]|nr:DUF438 domain-containing protein [Thermoplasmata archaeon]